jgi:pimeloyl-ACP methyl ester carboxylesterase
LTGYFVKPFRGSRPPFRQLPGRPGAAGRRPRREPAACRGPWLLHALRPALRRGSLAALAALAAGLLLSLLPAPPAAAKPGDLLEVTPTGTLSAPQIVKTTAELFESDPNPQARFAVDTFLIYFASVYPDGSPARVTAQLFVPRLPERRTLPLYVFAPGSTGLIEICRPSREHLSGIRWRQYRTHVLALAGQGVIGLMPDYMGFGDPGRIQPYFHAVSEGRALLDGIRAVRAYFERYPAPAVPQPGAFVAGYSQGGHAAFAAADLQSEYAPEVRLSGVIGYGPTTGLEAVFREFTVVAPMVVYAYSQIYGAGRFDPARILAAPWASRLADDVTRMCIGGIQSYYPNSVRQMFQPAFAAALLEGRLADAYPGIHAILAENSAGLSGHGVPALILQGTDDPVVHRATQDAFVIALRRAGSQVRYLVYGGIRHDTRQVAFRDVLPWMEAAGGREAAARD